MSFYQLEGKYMYIYLPMPKYCTLKVYRKHVCRDPDIQHLVSGQLHDSTTSVFEKLHRANLNIVTDKNLAPILPLPCQIC
jgi:hypothetical protein